MEEPSSCIISCFVALVSITDSLNITEPQLNWNVKWKSWICSSEIIKMSFSICWVIINGDTGTGWIKVQPIVGSTYSDEKGRLE